MDPDTYDGYSIDGIETSKSSVNSYTEAAMEGNPYEKPYNPVPLLGNKSLDVFGLAIIKIIYPQIKKSLTRGSEGPPGVS